MTNKKIYILYHGPTCCDGFGSAYAAWKFFKDKKNVVYVPVNYNDNSRLSLNDFKDNDVYIIDFSYPKEKLLSIKSIANKIVVLDHHKTAKEQLSDLDFTYFDIEKSGAMLSWEYFNKNKPAPNIIKYIQDKDLWKWNLPYSKEINAVIQSLDITNVKTFLDFDFYEEKIKNSFEDIVSEGKSILRCIDQNVNLAIERGVVFKTIKEHSVPAVNTVLFESEIGNKLLDLYPQSPFSATFFSVNNKEEKWSLRSRGDFDVSSIAKLYGGGGHMSAAGFTKKNHS